MRPALILQTASLGLTRHAPWACFTAFNRTGDLLLTPFCPYWVTERLFGWPVYGRRPFVAVWLPSILAVLDTGRMFAGE